MSDDLGLLAAAEGTSAEIAWIIVYVLCCVVMVAPFLVWFAGVRTPRAERQERARTAEGTVPLRPHDALADADDDEDDLRAGPARRRSA
jgi:hypothetical protein